MSADKNVPNLSPTIIPSIQSKSYILLHQDSIEYNDSSVFLQLSTEVSLWKKNGLTEIRLTSALSYKMS